MIAGLGLMGKFVPARLTGWAAPFNEAPRVAGQAGNSQARFIIFTHFT
jgi:hypothetical protein